jgi:hypothetical protein
VSTQENFDPRGACSTCRFFIDDRREVTAEILHLNNSGALVLHTAERVGTDGVRNVDLQLTVEQGLARLGLTPARVGLCEIGVARFCDREAGKQGKWGEPPNDKCVKWQAQAITSLRPRNWRKHSRRYPDDAAFNETKTAQQWAAQVQRLAPTSDCPCGSGQPWAFCCEPKLKLNKDKKS